jgi:hypothetical protein
VFSVGIVGHSLMPATTLAALRSCLAFQCAPMRAISHGAGRRYWTTRRGYMHAFSQLSRQWQMNPMTSRLAERKYAATGEPSSSSGEISDAVALLQDRSSGIAKREVATLQCDDSRLRHQLNFGSLARAAVVRKGPAIGACSYYTLPNTAFGNVAFFDYVASTDDDGCLADEAFSGCIQALRERRCEKAFALGEPNNDPRLLERLGFRPCIPSYSPLIVSWDKSKPIPNSGAFCPSIYR